MGWTSYHATYYDNRGRIDRKKELDSYFKPDNGWRVLKSSMVGSVYYAAVQTEDCVFAAVFLTSTDMKDYFNFSYKDMDETMHPYYYDCPKSILNLLSPTENKSANEWRQNCEKYRNKAARLRKLPVGTVIEFGESKGLVRLTKQAPLWSRGQAYWTTDDHYYMPIKYIYPWFRIIEKEETK